MLKGIIILSLAFYVFYKITSFFFKAGAASQQFRKQQPDKQFNNGDKKDKPGNGAVKGGEYVDYEEVK
ncbi:MAG TPA: hypothetical protein VK508_12390 [Cyclobacteriaceae bacterium]|nr:hypothetical protein [Cyclobacteriaceae bacterium]